MYKRLQRGVSAVAALLPRCHRVARCGYFDGTLILYCFFFSHILFDSHSSVLPSPSFSCLYLNLFKVGDMLYIVAVISIVAHFKVSLEIMFKGFRFGNRTWISYIPPPPLLSQSFTSILRVLSECRNCLVFNFPLWIWLLKNHAPSPSIFQSYITYPSNDPSIKNHIAYISVEKNKQEISRAILSSLLQI